MRKSDIFRAAITNVVILTASLAFAAGVHAGMRPDGGTCTMTNLTVRQLHAAQRATGRYHSIKAAEADLYEDIFLPIPNMGEHYLNTPLLLDGIFDPTKPELLVYNDFGTGHQRRLVALEYAVPIELSPNGPPEGFDGDCDEWHVYGGILWTLHAWVWYENPDGVFAGTNPRVP